MRSVLASLTAIGLGWPIASLSRVPGLDLEKVLREIGPYTVAHAAECLAEGPSTARYWRAAGYRQRAAAAELAADREDMLVEQRLRLPGRSLACRATAPRGSCAAETSRLGSHVPLPSAATRARAADIVQRWGYAFISIGDIEHERTAAALSTPNAVTAGPFAAELDAFRSAGARSLLVTVDSRGGSAVEGLGIVRALRRFAAEAGPVIALVSGNACSMAACIVTGGADFTIAEPGSSWMVHNPSGGADGDRLCIAESMFDLLAEGSLLPPHELRDWLELEMRFPGSAAFAHGFADELGERERAHELALGAARRPAGTAARLPRSFRQQALAFRRSEAHNSAGRGPCWGG